MLEVGDKDFLEESLELDLDLSFMKALGSFFNFFLPKVSTGRSEVTGEDRLATEKDRPIVVMEPLVGEFGADLLRSGTTSDVLETMLDCTGLRPNRV